MGPASKRKKAVLLLFILVMAPAMFLILRTGKHSFTYLPYYGEKEVNAPGDTTYYQVPPFTFTDAYGVAEPVVLAALVVMLVAVFFAGSWFERRGPGPVSAEQAVAGAE